MLSQYYADCEEVATLRQKQVCQGLLHLNVFAQSCSQARAQDERHQGRAAKQAEQQKTDMLNSKKYVSIATIKFLVRYSSHGHQYLPDIYSSDKSDEG